MRTLFYFLFDAAQHYQSLNRQRHKDSSLRDCYAASSGKCRLYRRLETMDWLQFQDPVFQEILLNCYDPLKRR